MTKLDRIVACLDRELRGERFRDDSHNGLQVANDGRVTRVCGGVDANLEFFEEAQRRGADLLICHHGLSWGDSMTRLTGLQYRRVAFLVRHNMALYASHLPLDAHPRLGHNAQICRALGIRGLKPFGRYHGTEIGWSGRLARPMSYAAFKKRVEALVHNRLQTMDYGPRVIRTVAVVSGGAASLVEEAGRAGMDVFLSGEPALQARTSAMEYGVNAVFAGHYATELFGVKALAGYLARRFRLPCETVDFRVPF
ncbi:MAG: Nif3-like dinuclear metal center hexameric protein [Verrucomicrobia bacterium]|nr:Nif3-like dinuclear metal center hexameric protein [Verrucomicrobiota bacterium]MBU1910049.1 Nif3-like dinuclear metal center hexameric protein [Verrucomicrobiota bacterium]